MIRHIINDLETSSDDFFSIKRNVEYCCYENLKVSAQLASWS